MAADYSPQSVFLFFCVMMILHLVWVRLMVRETKGVPLEQMLASFDKGGRRITIVIPMWMFPATPATAGGTPSPPESWRRPPGWNRR